MAGEIVSEYLTEKILIIDVTKIVIEEVSRQCELVLIR